MNKIAAIIILIVLAILGPFIKWLSTLTPAELAGVICLVIVVMAIIVAARRNRSKVTSPVESAPFRIKEPSPARHVEDLRRAPRFPTEPLSQFIGKRPKIIIFVDLETNGLSPSSSVLSCSAIKCHVDPSAGTLTQLDRFNRYYYPKERINHRAIAVNGLTRDEIKRLRGSYEYPRYFIEDGSFQAFCDTCHRIVAHNCSFDRSFLPFFTGQSFCTMRHNTNVVCAEWMPWKGEYKWPTLLETAKHYGIPVDESMLHKSNADVDITLQIFQRMLEGLDRGRG